MRIANSTLAYLVAAMLAALTGNALADDRVLELAIHGAKSPAKPTVWSVLENDRVVVRVTSDQPVQVHLHGYDIESDVAPNHPASLRFTANATGRFPIEIHSKEPKKQKPLAYIEVQPR
jgi:hypothetical protein